MWGDLTPEDSILTAGMRRRQDKLLQKQHFQGHGVPLVDFQSIGDADELRAAGEEFGFPFMLKSRRHVFRS